MTRTSPDVLLIGAGPAGTVSAALLHKAGLTVTVVEKQHFPRFVIGESLLPHCMDILQDADLLDAVAAKGFIVKRGATFLRGDERSGFDFGDQFTDGWTWTWQVPRAEFDETLARAVEARGIPILWGHSVTAISLPGDGYDPSGDAPGPAVTVVDEQGEPTVFTPRFVIDASGWGRVLPRLLDLEAPSGQATRQALFAHVTGDRRPEGDEDGRIWVCLHPDGAWIWVIPFHDGRTSVGVVAPPAFWDALPADPTEAFHAALAGDPNARERLADITLCWDTPRALKGYSAAVKQTYGPGYALVGNATEFLDPVLSSGVLLALSSARFAASATVRALKGEAVDWDTAYATPLHDGVEVFRTFVDSWYDGSLVDIFFADSSSQEAVFRPQICSVLAGYVWDRDNPFVRAHKRRVGQTARLVRGELTAPA